MWAISPPASSVLELTDTARDSCTIQWSAVAPPAHSLITGYIVYIDDGLDGDFSVGYDGSTNPSLVFAKISGLNYRTIYRIKVAALNKAG